MHHLVAWIVHEFDFFQFGAKRENRIKKPPALSARPQMFKHFTALSCLRLVIDETVDGSLMVCAGHVVLLMFQVDAWRTK